MDPRSLKTHPVLSSLFTIDPRVQAAIEDSMKTMGYMQAHPIELGVWPGQAESVVVDGHTRLAAALAAGLEDVAVHETLFISEDEAVRYAVHNQRDRRNLTAAELHALIQAIDKPHSRGGNRKGAIKGSRDPLKGTSAKETAKAVGTSEKTVKRSRVVASDPEIEAKVKAGDISLKEAERQVREKRKAKALPATTKIDQNTDKRIDLDTKDGVLKGNSRYQLYAVLGKLRHRHTDEECLELAHMLATKTGHVVVAKNQVCTSEVCKRRKAK